MVEDLNQELNAMINPTKYRDAMEQLRLSEEAVRIYF